MRVHAADNAGRGQEREGGRRIILAPLPIATAGPCGLWLATDQIDFICFEQNTSGLHQQHIVLHELGHILLDREDPGSVLPVLSAVVPLVSPETLRMMLARQPHGYQPEDELDAEMFAYTILSQAHKRIRAAPHELAEMGKVRRRLLAALEG